MAADPFGGAQKEGKKAVQAERNEINKLLDCVLCGRSGGHLRDGNVICRKCREELCPSEFGLALWALGMDETELAEYAGVSRSTVSRARRGDRISKRSAQKLAELLQLDPEKLRKGSSDE